MADRRQMVLERIDALRAIVKDRMDASAFDNSDVAEVSIRLKQGTSWKPAVKATVDLCGRMELCSDMMKKGKEA